MPVLTDPTDTAKRPKGIYAALDPGIKDAVEFLRKNRVNTSGSCDAKHDDRKGQPWISVEPPNMKSTRTERKHIVEVLLKGGYRGFTVEEQYLYQKGPLPWKTNIVITFWGEAKPE